MNCPVFQHGRTEDINGMELVTVVGKQEYNASGENPADKRSVWVQTVVVGVYNVNAGNVEDSLWR